MIKYGSICSGIESATVAWHPLGMRPSWFSEIEPFPSAVLNHHWPEVANLGDMCALPSMVASGLIEAPDVLVGGTPCQAFSVAGLRKGLDDERGQLTLKYVELLNEIDKKRQPDDECVAVWENVPGVLSSRDNAFGCFLGALAGEDCELQPSGKRWTKSGVVFGPQRTIAWRILDAQYFGVAQRRRRVFVVASARNGFNPQQVLFEREGLRRDIAPSREARENITDGVTNSFREGSFRQYVEGEVGTLKASGGVLSGGSETFVTTTKKPLMFKIRGGGGNGGKGYLGSKDKTFTISTRQDQYLLNENKAFNVTFCDANGTRKDRPNGGLYVNETNVSKTLTSGGDRSTYLVDGAICLGGQHPNAAINTDSSSPTITAAMGAGGGHVPLVTDSKVRRLTPVECERLQGFPDNHTKVPYRNKSPDDCPDGPRYKAIGNSKAVPVIQWVGWRVLNELKRVGH